MAIWAEIKKAINSNLNLPLDKKIDKDIDDVRIGKAFQYRNNSGEVSTVRTNFDINNVNDNYCSCLRMINGSFYYWSGFYERGMYKLSSDLKTKTLISKNKIPYETNYSIGFVYKNEPYLAGGSGRKNGFFKYNLSTNLWEEKSLLPFSLDEQRMNSNGVEYKDKIYLYDNSAVKIRRWNGNEIWDEVPYLPLESDFQIRYATLFTMDDKLYFSFVYYKLGYSNSFNMFKVYVFNDEIDKFVDSDIPLCETTILGESNYITPLLYFKVQNELYGYRMRPNLYKYENKTWYSIHNLNNYDIPDSTNARSDLCFVSNDKVIFTRDSTIIIINLNYYIDIITSDKYVAKNSTFNHWWDIKNKNLIIPITNCEVINEKQIRAISDGKVEYRVIRKAHLDTSCIVR